jgi:regulator of protease activity HflC (stomatin/prohibitin superfamily)
MQIVVAAVPGQEAIPRDNVTLRVHAVVYYRVIDPLKAIINVQNYHPWGNRLSREHGGLAR